MHKKYASNEQINMDRHKKTTVKPIPSQLTATHQS